SRIYSTTAAFYTGLEKQLRDPGIARSCNDGTERNTDMTESIQVLIARHLDVDKAAVTETARLREDLDMDEISSMELGLAISELTGTEVSEEDMDELITVQDVMQFIQRAG
ncbi:acyl carrier protein, partial [Faecalibaculum rodentium]|uniref:acyl carrier protein n=3 Tax=Faecalibaculum rodentium TaxID=1702221 RepID=UPI0026073F9F